MSTSSSTFPKLGKHTLEEVSPVNSICNSQTSMLLQEVHRELEKHGHIEAEFKVTAFSAT